MFPNKLLLKPTLLSESVFLSEISSKFPGLNFDDNYMLSNNDKVLLTYDLDKLVSVLNFLSLNDIVSTREILFEKLHSFLNVEILDYNDLDDINLEGSSSSDAVDSVVNASSEQCFEALEKLNVLKDKYDLSNDELNSPWVKLFFETTSLSDMNSLLVLRSTILLKFECFTNLEVIELLIFFKNNLEDRKLFLRKFLEYRTSNLLNGFGNYNHDFKNMLFCFLFDSSLKVDFETRKVAVNSFLILFNEQFPVSVRMISFLVLSSLFEGFALVCSKEFLSVLNEFMENAQDSLDFTVEKILDQASFDQFIEIFNLLENFNLFYSKDVVKINFSNYLNFTNLNTSLLKSFIIYNGYSLDFLESQIKELSNDEHLDSLFKIYGFGSKFHCLVEEYLLRYDSDFQFNFWSKFPEEDLLMKLNSDYGYLSDENSEKLLSYFENATIEELDLLNSSDLLSFKYEKILLKKRIELRIDKLKYKFYEAINLAKKVIFVSVLSSFALSIMFALLRNYFDTNVLSEFFVDFNVSDLFDLLSSDVPKEPLDNTVSINFVEPTSFVEPTDTDKIGDLVNDTPIMLDKNEVLPESVQIQTENPGSRVHMRDADGEILKNRFGFNRYWKDGARLVVDANSSYEKAIDGEPHMFYEILRSGQRTGRFISSSTWR